MSLTPDNPLYAWGGLNRQLFLWLNSFHSTYWDALMLTMTALGDHANYPFYMALALLISAWRPQWLPRNNVLILGVGYVITGSIVLLLKPLLDFPRPLLALGSHWVHVVGRPEFHHSFPSGHATFAVLLAASLSYQAARPLRWGLWIFALLVCLSRPVLGAHFPVDILSGALIAGLTVLLLRWLLKQWLPAQEQTAHA
ncbi:MAG: phosphatase PAP2 family protein [Sulfuriferula sp.]